MLQDIIVFILKIVKYIHTVDVFIWHDLSQHSRTYNLGYKGLYLDHTYSYVVKVRLTPKYNEQRGRSWK